MKYAQSKKGWTRPEALFACSLHVRRKSEYGEGTLYWCLLKQSGERKMLVSTTAVITSCVPMDSPYSPRFLGLHW